MERNPSAKVRPTFAFTSIWPMPGCWISTGSSMVMMFLSGWLMRGQGRVERGRLAAARGAGHQEDAVRPPHDASERLELGFAEPHLLQVEQILGVGQQSHHEALAEGDRHRREPDVVVLARDLEADAAVLRVALLGDVEVAHDLDARSDAGLQPARQRLHRLVEHVVDPEADADLLLEGLDVDVARPLLDRVLEKRVHEADDRRVVRGLEQILRLGDVEIEGIEVPAGLLGELVGGRVTAVVDGVDRLQDEALARELDPQVGAVEEQAEVVDGSRVEGVRRDDPDFVVGGAPDGDQGVLLREADRQPERGRLVDAVHGQLVEELQPELLGERAAQLVRVDQPLFQQDLGEGFLALELPFAGSRELFGLESGGAQEHRAEVDRLEGGRIGCGLAHGCSSVS